MKRTPKMRYFKHFEYSLAIAENRLSMPAKDTIIIDGRLTLYGWEEVYSDKQSSASGLLRVVRRTETRNGGGKTMSVDKRETPLTDAVEQGYFAVTLSTKEVFAHFRSLETMCAELAEALENHMFMTRPRDESKQALAKYEAMRKECGG